MLRGVLLNDRLENLLQANWANLLDYLLIKQELARHVSNTSFPVIEQEQIPPKQTKISTTKFEALIAEFEVWFEYSIPKDNGVVIGTIVCWLSLSGDLDIKESHGTHFVPKTP